tara:strand:- start:1787 stop:3151 length:1365 start_codon:yes stop_codon:yes gene_type:complete
MIPNDDTIVALATPNGIAAIGIIRLSGSKSLDYLTSCFTSSSSISPNTVYVGNFKDPLSNETIDKVCVTYFKSPKSYTGEDSAEVHCHSSQYVIKAILNSFICLGARLAQSGEFSKRAYMNGKLTLTQSESVIDLIHSQTKLQHTVSLNRVEGKLYRHINLIRNELLNLLEQLEGSIDFPDEVPSINRSLACKSLESISKNINHIISLQDLGKSISDGVHCLFLGKPNVGKSSIFNALLGEDRSIVTDTPGTTRDYISEQIEYNGIQFTLYDTAGLRHSDDIIEFLGMKKIQSLIKKATIIIWVCDQSEELTADDFTVFDHIKHNTNYAILSNKVDLSLKRSFHIPDAKPLFQQSCSALSPESLNDFKQSLYEYSVSTYQDQDLEFLCNVRQFSCIKQLASLISNLLTQLKTTFHDDMIAIDLRHCIESCSELTGDSITEEVLDGIFSRFCVGK